MTLGQRIQEHRLKLGLSQAGLGEKLGVSRQAVSRWEADGAVPDTDKLIALSRLFGLTLNELLQVEPPSEPAEHPPVQAAPVENTAPPGRRSRVRWKMFLLAAVCFLAGLAVGVIPDIAGRLAPPEPGEAVTEWNVRLQSGPYMLDQTEVVELSVTVTLSDPDILEDTEVFFQAETSGGETVRAEAAPEEAPLAESWCSATLTVPNSGGTIYVGFAKNGREQLGLLGEYSRFFSR